MSAGYTFIGSVVGEEIQPIATACLVAGLVISAGVVASKSLARDSNNLVPETSLSSRNIFEILSEFLLWLGDTAMGVENRKYLPFVGSIFVFVLMLNLIGLVPGFVMPTDKVQFNFGIAIIVFLGFNFWGIKEHGIINYLKHIWGPLKQWYFIPIGLFLFSLELLSFVIRPITLSLRLFGNMTGDHLALSVFSNITSGIYVPVPVVFYLLGTLVCFIQAFVFTLLTMIYIRLAVAHDHSEEAEGHH